MRAGLICSFMLLSPLLAAAAEPKPTDNQAEHGASAMEALKQKLAEAEKLQGEIEQLRQLAATPGPETQLRVQVIEVLVSEARRMGLEFPLSDEDDAKNERLFRGKIERLIPALLAQYGIAKLVADERVSIVEGAEGRVRAGAELPAETLAKVNADPARFAFRGVELAATPMSQADGRVALELVCRQFRPILYSSLGPRLRVEEISASVKLAPGETVVLVGAQQERVASEVRGLSKSGLEIGTETQTVHRIQTLVVVSREPLPAEKTDR